MKTFIPALTLAALTLAALTLAALTLAALVATSAVAQAPKVERIRDAANIYQSIAPGNQTFPDTDRYFDGQNARRID